MTAFCALVATVGADAHWLAALGRTIVRLGAIPKGVPYAAAYSGGWENVPVVGELVFHGLESGLGDQGLVMLQVLAVAVALVCLAYDMRQADAADGPSALVLLLVAVAAASPLLVVRAQVFSLALFPATVVPTAILANLCPTTLPYLALALADWYLIHPNRQCEPPNRRSRWS